MEQAFSKDWQASYFEASQELFNEMIAWRSSLPGECPEGVFPFQSRLGIELIWVVGDAKNYSGDPYSTDCIYFDPFSPVTNPDLWNRQVMELALQNLVPGGKLCSYCVASKIRKRLEEVGLTYAASRARSAGREKSWLPPNRNNRN